MTGSIEFGLKSDGFNTAVSPDSAVKQIVEHEPKPSEFEVKMSVDGATPEQAALRLHQLKLLLARFAIDKKITTTLISDEEATVILSVHPEIIALFHATVEESTIPGLSYGLRTANN